MAVRKWKKTITMSRSLRLLAVYLVPIISIVAVGAALECRAQDNDYEIPFADAEVFIELNNTDGDLGFHSNIDGDPWRRLIIEDPQERKILNIYTNGRLRRQGLTQLSFESAEPSFDELNPHRFFQRFPEGEYEIEGVTLDRQELASTAMLTHLLPAPPENLAVNGVVLEQGCGEDPGPIVSGPLVISWEEVIESHPELGRTGEPVEVVLYQIVLEHLDPGLSFTADLPPTATEMIVPETFTDEGGIFKLEILVKEESGNQTAVETCFTVE